MSLAVRPPVLPMLAKRVDEIPRGAGWVFEPKWDGFRVLVFRDGRDVHLQSRDAKPLARYFPELLAPLRAQLPRRCVLDGEVVIARGGALDFDALQMRLHPAASRVERLARETPASVVFFDALCVGARDLRARPFAERRAALEHALAGVETPLHLTPATRDRRKALDWFRRFEGAGLDGVMAKRSDGPYEPDVRAMLKVKHERDCDCVVAGFRWHTEARGAAVGSLLLGLYDDAGALQHVGSCASLPMETRRALVAKLAPHRTTIAKHPWGEAGFGDAGGGRRRPGEPSRWTADKDLSWEPLRPRLVLEVAYDHMQGGRFRHTAQFRRWRRDKKARACTFAQLEVVPPHELARIFRDERARRSPA